MVLNAIYEGDFVGFSYGFRPGRGPHDALDALSTAIKIRRVNWILDADIRNFFGAVSQDWLVRFLEHRLGDKRIIPYGQKIENCGKSGQLSNSGASSPRVVRYVFEVSGCHRPGSLGLIF
jgi:retron-type reverse transcriptase